MPDFINESEEIFDLPRIIKLGAFPAERTCLFSLEVSVQSETAVATGIRGVRVSPERLAKGTNMLTLEISPVRDGTIIYGELFLESNMTKTVYITGKSVANRLGFKDGAVVYRSSQPRRNESPRLGQPEGAVESQRQPEAKETVVPVLKKRGRVDITPFTGGMCGIKFSVNPPAPLDIDPYVFMLDMAGNAVGYDNLIFFGNPSDKAGSAEVNVNMKTVSLDFSAVPPEVSRISVAYSIYDGGAEKNFSVIREFKVRFLSEKEEKLIFYPELTYAHTLTAFDFYRREGGGWIIEADGTGFSNGIKGMCEMRGIRVL